MTWLGFPLTVVSFILLGRKRRSGWLVSCVACLLWIVVTTLRHDWPMLTQQVFLFGIGIFYYTRWKSD